MKSYFVIHTSPLRYIYTSDGGWPVVDQHFSKVGEKNPRTHRWNIKCHYCKPDAVMEHCELRCTEHLSTYKRCPKAPESVRQEALQRLATKRGLLSSVPIDELGTPSNPHVVGDDDDDDANADDGPMSKSGRFPAKKPPLLLRNFTRGIILKRLTQYRKGLRRRL